MKFFTLSFLIFFVVSTMGQAQKVSQQKMDSVYAKHQELLKQLAFCDCLGYAFKDDSLYTKKDISKSVLFDISQYGYFKAYHQVDSLAKSFANAIPIAIQSDYAGKRAITFRCLQFYHSSQLDALVRSLNSELQVDFIMPDVNEVSPAPKTKKKK